MKRLPTLLALLGGALTLTMSGDALACGDKLVVVGRGLHAKGVRAPQRASILLFAEPKSSVAAALEDGNLRKDLERPGHRLRSATSKEEARSRRGHRHLRLLRGKRGSAPGVLGRILLEDRAQGVGDSRPQRG